MLSDLHLPNVNEQIVRDTVATLVDMKVRFVIITGDFTNGAIFDRRIHSLDKWWRDVRAALQPLRDAGIAVLPVAGNHDTYTPWQRDGYARAFADLDQWAKPFTIEDGAGASRVSHAPFSYSVDVDNVHLSLAHVVTQSLDKDVAAWLKSNLLAAAGAQHRLVFGHVPMSSVIRPPKQWFAKALGTMLEQGKAEMYVAGHEHIVWDEDVPLPDGGKLRQVMVGCSSGFYNFQPSPGSRVLAHCERITGKHEPMACTMPEGGGEFTIARGRKNRRIQHYKNSFTLFTVDGDSIAVRPMTVIHGHAKAFYLNDTRVVQR